MGRTLTDEDFESLATRVVQLIGKRLSDPGSKAEMLPAPKPLEPPKQLPQKLVFTLKDLSGELGISKASIYRLEARGLLKSLPYLRTKHYTRAEVERFLQMPNWKGL